MSNSQLIRVAIVDDEHPIRKGLSLILNGTPGFCCVGAYRSVEEALQSIGREAPDVLLLDIYLQGGMLGSEGVGHLLEKYPTMQILMLTVTNAEEHIFESLCHGACGYLLKKTPPAELLAAIRDLHQGGAPMSSEIARKVVRLFKHAAPPPKADHNLTPHEVRLLGLLAEGYSYQATAYNLDISINTVRYYVRSIYDKLKVHSKTEAVQKALKNRII